MLLSLLYAISPYAYGKIKYTATKSKNLQEMHLARI